MTNGKRKIVLVGSNSVTFKPFKQHPPQKTPLIKMKYVTHTNEYNPV